MCNFLSNKVLKNWEFALTMHDYTVTMDTIIYFCLPQTQTWIYRSSMYKTHTLQLVYCWKKSSRKCFKCSSWVNRKSKLQNFGNFSQIRQWASEAGLQSNISDTRAKGCNHIYNEEVTLFLQKIAFMTNLNFTSLASEEYRWASVKFSSKFTFLIFVARRKNAIEL